MGTTAPVNVTAWDGTQGQLRYRRVWDAASDDTDLAIIDISALAPAPLSVKIQRVQAIISGDYTATLEFDATTDQIIDQWGGQSDISNQVVIDYTGGPNKGVVGSDTSATGWTGDVVLTTSGVASGDELNIVIDFAASTR